MKKLVFVVLFVVLLISNTFSQNPNVIKLLPFSLHYNSIGFEWEHREGKNSLIVGIGLPYESSIMNRKYKSFHVNTNDYYFASMHTYYIKLGYRYYIKNGLYTEGSANSTTLGYQALINNKLNKEIDGKVEGYFYSAGIGGKIGYQKVFKFGLVLDAYIGADLTRSNGNATLTSYKQTDYSAKFVKNLITNYIPNNANVTIEGDDNNAHKYRLNTFTYPIFKPGISIGYRF